MDWSGQTMLQNVWILFLLYIIIVSDWTKAPTKKAYFLGLTEPLAKVKNSLWFLRLRIPTCLANQLVIYKRDQGLEVRNNQKQIQLAVRAGI